MRDAYSPVVDAKHVRELQPIAAGRRDGAALRRV